MPKRLTAEERTKILDEALELVENGLTLKAIEAQLGVDTVVLCRMMHETPQVEERHARARKRGAYHRLERHIAELEASGDPIEIARARELLRIDMWALPRMDPKTFGDKLTLGGDAENPLVTQVTRVIVDGRTKD